MSSHPRRELGGANGEWHGAKYLLPLRPKKATHFPECLNPNDRLASLIDRNEPISAFQAQIFRHFCAFRETANVRMIAIRIKEGLIARR